MGSHAEKHAHQDAPMSPVTVRVDRPGRGAWEVAMSNQPGRPCELTVCALLFKEASRFARMPEPP